MLEAEDDSVNACPEWLGKTHRMPWGLDVGTAVVPFEGLDGRRGELLSAKTSASSLSTSLSSTAVRF
ncbi:hypothetical protein MRX96_007780 [Rhipicephalus microplus]